jgi:hypothetical protein
VSDPTIAREDGGGALPSHGARELSGGVEDGGSAAGAAMLVADDAMPVLIQEDRCGGC